MNAVVPHERRTTLQPQTFAELERFAERAAKSTLVPKDFIGRPDNIIIAVQWGHEIGLGPLQAMQNIAVINGRPAIWGDAMLALVRGSGVCAYVREASEGQGDNMVAVCRCARKGEEGETVVRFSVEDAKRAGLWGKGGPWQQYPRRMLQLRARGFALRDAFPDVLRGVISGEEAQDISADHPPLTLFRGETIEGKAEPAPEPQRAAASATPRPERVYAPEEPEPGPERPGISRDDQAKLDGWIVVFGNAQTTDAVRKVENSMRYQTALSVAPAAIVEALRAMCTRAYARVQPQPEAPPPPVETAPEMATAGGEAWPE